MISVIEQYQQIINIEQLNNRKCLVLISRLLSNMDKMLYKFITFLSLGMHILECSYNCYNLYITLFI